MISLLPPPLSLSLSLSLIHTSLIPLILCLQYLTESLKHLKCEQEMLEKIERSGFSSPLFFSVEMIVTHTCFLFSGCFCLINSRSLSLSSCWLTHWWWHNNIRMEVTLNHLQIQTESYLCFSLSLFHLCLVSGSWGESIWNQRTNTCSRRKDEVKYSLFFPVANMHWLV